KELSDVNILLIPVGSVFTIGPEEAWEVVNQLKPNIVIPMHYKTKYLR
ncbi:MAG: MBL fold metallo-hydrolase, partial [Caldiserica bacterium]|nr:MBL fold metallo-hydrolase [Caldisericota bacterium]